MYYFLKDRGLTEDMLSAEELAHLEDEFEDDEYWHEREMEDLMD